MQDVREYRYGRAARQRAVIMAALSSLVLVGLLGVLITRWAEFSVAMKIPGAMLLLILAFTVRAQIARIVYRCHISAERLQIIAPLSSRSIPWANIVEVRRIMLPQVSRERRWACTVLTRNARGGALPTYVFDSQLEDADAALHDVVQHTPQAQHTNV